VTLQYPLESTIPVVSPRPAWYITKDERGLVWPVSTVTIDPSSPNDERILTNKLVPDDSEPRCQATPQHSCLKTIDQLLFKELGEQKQSRDLSNLEYFWTGCNEEMACQDSAMMQFLLTLIHHQFFTWIFINMGPAIQFWDKAPKRSRLRNHGLITG
jgi:hypothetical protein